MNIGIYGGSFDPPHLGHLNVVLNELNVGFLDKIVVVPCFQQTGKDLAHFYYRFTMCQRMFGDLPNVFVSKVEEILGGESITLRTIEHFKRSSEYEYANLYLIVGEDIANAIPNWKGGNELL